MVELEQREKVRMTLGDRIADFVTANAGSMAFVWLNVAWYVAWIGAHLLGLLDFDPFPFSLLTMIVSLEAIGLAIFVLISQNRQALLADKRAKLDLQVNLIAEQEVTKLIDMVSRIAAVLDVDTSEVDTSEQDPEVKRMRQPTHVRNLADTMEEFERAVDKDSANGPRSAANTEA